MQYERWEDEANVNEHGEQIDTEGKEEKAESNLDKSDKKLKKKMSNIVEQTSQQQELKEEKITAA